MARLQHGGNIDKAAARFGRPVEQWLDLSAGINPSPWKFEEALPARCLEQLPYPCAAFYSTAARYYGSHRLLATPGSQAVIQALPLIQAKTQKVMVPLPGYEEHAWHWRDKGHKPEYYPADTNADDLLERVRHSRPDVVVVINPNNPACKLHQRAELLEIQALLSQWGGLLVVDEAFIDTRPENSLFDHDAENLVVLRSLGKFFGLPGLRVGFVSCCSSIKEQLETALGPWAIAGASQYIAAKSLADVEWQKQALQLLRKHAEYQLEFLQEAFSGFDDFAFKATDFFVSSYCSRKTAKAFYEYYAQQGILVRVFDFGEHKSGSVLRHEAMVRLGLCPGVVESHAFAGLSGNKALIDGKQNLPCQKWSHFKLVTERWVQLHINDSFRYEKN